MIEYVRVSRGSPLSFSHDVVPKPAKSRKATNRVSLYRSDYRPQSGPSQPLQTSSLALFLFFFLSLFPSFTRRGTSTTLRRRQWTQRSSLFLEVSKSSATPFPSFFLLSPFPFSRFPFLFRLSPSSSSSSSFSFSFSLSLSLSFEFGLFI